MYVSVYHTFYLVAVSLSLICVIQSLVSFLKQIISFIYLRRQKKLTDSMFWFKVYLKP